MDKRAFVAEIAKLRPSSTFLFLHKYRNAEGEISDYNIIFHMSYENALKKSLLIVEQFEPADALQEKAKTEIINSFSQSLLNLETVPIEEIEDAYNHYQDDEGKYIKGVKLHRDSDTLHLYGLLHSKKVIVPGTYKEVNSRPLTIEKKKIQKLCPVSKFRQFRVHPSQLERIAVEKMSLLPPE